MRRPVFVALCTASVVAIGIAASIERTAVGAEDQASRPLSKIPPVERFGQAALDDQARFLQRMAGVSIRYGDNGAVSEIKGRTGVLVQSGFAGFRVGEPSKELLEKFAPALLAAGTEELVVRIAGQSSKGATSPERTIRLVQYIRGREVQRSAVNISLNTQTNEVTHFVADFLPDRGLQHEPRLTAAEARAAVEAAMRDSGLEEERKIIFEDAPARLAYAFEEIGDRGGIGGVLVWVFQASRNGEAIEASVSALTGKVIRFTARGFGLNRISYTANNAAPLGSGFPSGLTFTFGEGGTPPDSIAGNAYNKAGITYGVFSQAFGRNSWNGAGGAQRLVTHYAMSTNGGAHQPPDWFIFGDAAANDQDTASHEFTHAIAYHETSMPGDGPVDGAPAIQEAYGDWGATVSDVHLNLGFVSPGTWSISEAGLRNWQIPVLAGVGFRDWFPSRTFISNGQGKYNNSTIMGHAFYLLAQNGVTQHYRAGLPGSGVPVIPVTGLSYQSARDIFWNAIFDPSLTASSNFFSMRDATFTAAIPLGHHASVAQAWDAVGVGHNCSSAPQPPNVVVSPGYCQGRHRLEWSAVPGATTYHGQVTRQELGWAFAATVVDASVTSCRQNVPPGFWLFRLRACNGCGCSAWGTERYMEYWSGPCA